MQSAFGGQKPTQDTATNPFRGRGRGRGQQGRATFQHGKAPSAPKVFGQNTRAAQNGSVRGTRGRGASRGRGNFSKTFNSSSTNPVAPKSNLPVLPIDPPPEQIKVYSHEQLEARRTQLNEQYEKYRQNAIARGLMSDDKQSSLDDAIKTVGTCTQMCDEKERINRIYESQTDAAERLPAPGSGKQVPIEGRMVKKFRRSAAGVDKQIPEELRTPHTLKKTLDYLFDEVLGKTRLGKHHKFVWDRTRAIRNDFSIQSLTKPEFVRDEVECYERIVRFHILSAHQLSNPENLAEDEHFEHQQELEQLQKTFQSLLDRYDAFRSQLNFPHEAEFRAYYILFSPILFSFDTEIQIQAWPRPILNDGRVQTALTLYAAMGNTFRSVGSKNLDPIPVAIAQANIGRFWALLSSQRVGYLMACVAEMSFQSVRFTAMNALWRAAKVAPDKAQANMKSWTKTALMDYLRFDYEEDLDAFCERLGVDFKTGQEEDYLDFRSLDSTSLDNPFSKPEQVFSYSIVEEKRYGRTFVAVMNGMSIAKARRANMIEEDIPLLPATTIEKPSSMFIGDDEEEEEEQQEQSLAQPVKPFLDPTASAFTPSAFTPSNSSQPAWMSSFGQARSTSSTSTPFDASSKPPKGLFGASSTSDQPDTAAKSVFGLGPKANTPVGTSLKASTPPADQSSQTALPAESTNQNTSHSFPSFNGSTISAQSPFGKNTSYQASNVQSPVFSQPIAGNTSAAALTNSTSIFNLANASATPAAAASEENHNPPATSIFSQSQESSNTPLFQLPSSSAPSSAPLFQPQTSLPSFNPPLSTTPKQAPPFKFTDKAAVSGHDTSTSIFKSALDNTPATAVPLSSAAASPSQGQPKRPSLGEIKFPSVSASDSISLPSEPSSVPAVDSIVTSTQIGSILPPSTPFQPAAPPPEEPPKPKYDKNEVLNHLCRLGLVQEEGILDMFISYRVANLVKETFSSFQKDQLEQRITALRNQILRRKFFGKWRSAVEQRRLGRKAQSRRQRMAATIQAAHQKKSHHHRSMAQITEAQEERKRMQAEIKQKKEEEHRQAQARARKIEIEATRSTDRAPSAGQKRKITTTPKPASDIQDISMSPVHKRSRTLGALVDTSFLRTSVLDQNRSRKSLIGSDSLRRSLSQRSLNQSFRDSKLDQTKTDYFELRARGINPSPGNSQMESQTQHAPRQQPSPAEKIIRRSQSAHTRRPQSPIESSQSPSTSPADKSTAAKSAGAAGQDPFLQKLKDAQAALSADKDWFTTQTAALERQVQQEEEFRRSQDTLRSVESPILTQSSVFARSVSGRDYVPPPLKPGQTLSRTEQRIRESGARGLATKPFGGTPVGSPRSDYSSVAMSKRSASQLRSTHLVPAESADIASFHLTDHETPLSGDATAHPKRSIDDVYSNGHASPDVGHEQFIEQATKKQRNGIAPGPDLQSRSMKLTLMQNLQADELYDEDDDEEEEGDEEELVEYGDENESPQRRQYYSHEREEEYDTNEYGSEDEAEGSDDLQNYQDGHGPASFPYGDEEPVDENGDYMVPVSRSSRAVSAATPDTGVGSTADAAIELSD